LDLGSRGDIEPGAAEERLDAQPCLGHGMQAPQVLAPAGQGHIDPSRPKAPLDLLTPERLAARLDRRLEALLSFVDEGPSRGPLGRAERAQGLQALGERPPLPAPPAARLLDRGAPGRAAAPPAPPPGH